jgi:hypothetical protein
VVRALFDAAILGRQAVRWELDARIRAIGPRRRPQERQHAGQVQPGQAGGTRAIAPVRDGRRRALEPRGAVDQQQRLAVDPQVARVGQEGQHVVDEAPVGRRVRLPGDDHLVGAPVPGARPGLVGPVDAGPEVDRGIREHALDPGWP